MHLDLFDDVQSSHCCVFVYIDRISVAFNSDKGSIFPLVMGSDLIFKLRFEKYVENLSLLNRKSNLFHHHNPKRRPNVQQFNLVD